MANMKLWCFLLVGIQCFNSIMCDSEETLDSEETVSNYGQDKIVKAKVSLYMESLCPGCHQFIRNHLFPVFMKYPEYIQLDLLPYGNARHSKNSEDKWEFSCQHGDAECFGNLYLACATHILQAKRPKYLMRYYNCLAGATSSSIKEDVKSCAKEAYVNFRNLENCVKGPGKDYLAAFGDRTHALVGRRFVPTVVFDDKFDINEENAILSDFLSYLCKELKGKKPPVCNGNNNAKRFMAKAPTDLCPVE